MNDKVVDITTFAGRDLKSRITVRNLYDSIFDHDDVEMSVKIDFINVNFATRSFIDEFYNVFLNSATIKTELVNVSPEIQEMIKAVKSTQRKTKTAFVKPYMDSVVEFSSISEANKYLHSLSFH